MAALAVMLIAAAPVSAQVCGDANEDGEVGVSDGVQALRAAAGLSSLCEAACDLDTSGAVTVTDGVNILRKAAGLLVNEACDFTAQEANDVASPSLGLFDGLSKLPGLGGASADAAGTGGTAECDNPEGTVARVDTPNASSVTFTDCRIGPAILDGTISRAVFAQAVAIGFDGYRTTRVKNGKSLSFSGQLTLTNDLVGRRLSGILEVESSELGSLSLQFQRILLIGDGSVRGGELIFDFSTSSEGRIERMRIAFTTGDEFPVTIELRNGQVRQFILERGTRTIHLPG